MELRIARKKVMACKIKISVILFGLLAALILPAALHAEPGFAGSRPLAQDVFVPSWALKRYDLTQLAVASMVVGASSTTIRATSWRSVGSIGSVSKESRQIAGFSKATTTSKGCL
jgi:hypothetical protein